MTRQCSGRVAEGIAGHREVDHTLGRAFAGTDGHRQLARARRAMKARQTRRAETRIHASVPPATGIGYAGALARDEAAVVGATRGDEPVALHPRRCVAPAHHFAQRDGDDSRPSGVDELRLDAERSVREVNPLLEIQRLGVEVLDQMKRVAVLARLDAHHVHGKLVERLERGGLDRGEPVRPIASAEPDDVAIRGRHHRHLLSLCDQPVPRNGEQVMSHQRHLRGALDLANAPLWRAIERRCRRRRRTRIRRRDGRAHRVWTTADQHEHGERDGRAAFFTSLSSIVVRSPSSARNTLLPANAARVHCRPLDGAE